MSDTITDLVKSDFGRDAIGRQKSDRWCHDGSISLYSCTSG